LREKRAARESVEILAFQAFPNCDPFFASLSRPALFTLGVIAKRVIPNNSGPLFFRRSLGSQVWRPRRPPAMVFRGN